MFGQLRHTLADIRRYPQTMMFLIAYLLYNDAIQAVLALASQFGSDELKIPVSSLTLAILMVQFVGFFGAIGFQWLAAVTGAKRAIAVSLVLWTATLIYLFKWVYNTREFFIAAAHRGDRDGREPGAEPVAIRAIDSSWARRPNTSAFMK